MTYIDLINAFEKWLETNYLPISSQLLWYKLVAIFNRCGWSEWVTVDNHRLMSIMQINNEKTFIKCRDFLIKSNLFEYQKGKKGSPNKYKICTVNFTVQTTVQCTVKSTVYRTDIKDKDKDIYILLLNKYRGQMRGKAFKEKLKLINECKKEREYSQLTEDIQLSLMAELMAVK